MLWYNHRRREVCYPSEHLGHLGNIAYIVSTTVQDTLVSQTQHLHHLLHVIQIGLEFKVCLVPEHFLDVDPSLEDRSYLKRFKTPFPTSLRILCSSCAYIAESTFSHLSRKHCLKVPVTTSQKKTFFIVITSISFHPVQKIFVSNGEIRAGINLLFQFIIKSAEC